MSAFHDVRFPLALGLGASGGPERRNEIVTLTSGREKRNQRQIHARRRYDAGTGIRSLADLETLMAFFQPRRGSLHAFRFRDPFHWKSCPFAAGVAATDQMIGTGDGVATSFQLTKTYGSGAEAYQRPVTKPVVSTVLIALDGVSLTGGNAASVDGLTGIATLAAAPAPGTVVTAGFEFDVPVRFAMEQLTLSLAAFEAGQAPGIPLIEVLS